MDTRSTFIVYKKEKTFGSMGKYTHRYEYGTKSAHCNIDFCYQIKTCVQDGVTRFLLWLRYFKSIHIWKCTERGKETKRLDRQRSIMMVFHLYTWGRRSCGATKERTNTWKPKFWRWGKVVLVWLSENIPSARTKFGPVSSQIPDFEVSGLVTTIAKSTT